MKKKVILGAICSLLIIGGGSYYINYKNLKNNSKTNISKIEKKQKVIEISSNDSIKENNKNNEVNKKILKKSNQINHLENNEFNKKNSINKREHIKEYPKNNEISPSKKENLNINKNINKNITTFVSDNSKKSFKRYEKMLKDIKSNINVFHENLNKYIPNENTINMSSNIKAQDIYENIINLKENFKDLKELQIKGLPTSNIDNYSNILNAFNEYLNVLPKAIKFDWDFEHTGLIDRNDKKVLELEVIKKNLDDKI